jgi:type II secretory pathway pseudopilin PulG
MKNSQRGFLLVTVLFVLLIVSILGAVLLSSTMQNIQYVKHEKEILQAEETARFGLAYYKAYGIPPLVNGKPQKLHLFPQKNWILEIKRQGNTLILIGMTAQGSFTAAQTTYQVPLWDLHDFEKAESMQITKP